MADPAIDRRTPSEWKYIIPVALVAALGLALTAGMVSLQRHNVHEAADVVVDQAVTATAERAGQELGALDGSMGAVSGFFDIEGDVTEGEFRAFTRRAFANRPDIQAVQYAPRVNEGQRPAVEAQLARAGYATSIQDPTADGPRSSPVRPDYLPIMFSQPRAGNESSYGIDVLYRPQNATAVLEARDAGQSRVGGMIQIVQDQSPALLLFTPLYRPGSSPTTVEERRAEWSGIALVVLRIPQWMETAAGDSDPADLSLALLDNRQSSAELLWANAGSPVIQDTRAWSSQAAISVPGGEDLVLVGEPTPGMLAAQGAWRPWAALVAGLLITALLCAVIWKWLDARRIRRTADDLQHATNRLRFLAERDPLTGLAHRDGLRSWLDDWGARNPDRPLAVLFIDLDGFKEVNTSWGHPTGDLVLRQIGQRLTILAGDPDSTVARLGGDEFVVTRAMDRGSVDGLTTMVQTLISEPIPIGDRDVQLTSSIGIAVLPEDGVNLDTLLMNADIAVRRAKEQPADSVVRFDPVMAAESAAHRQLARALRVAMRHPDEHFFVEYQPQIDMRSGALVAAEALIRWRETSGRLVSPLAFIPIAREHGLMHRLGHWVLDQACQQVVEWRRETEAVVAVNVDTQQLTDDFADVVASVLERRRVAAEWLIIEVTESATMTAEAQRELDRVKGLGVNIAIDDFGTGFSSLSRLADLPTHQLKIDRAFVSGLGESAESLEIVRTIVALARALNLEALAEGVETPLQAEMLLSQGVYIAQGYLFARPLPPAACLQMWHTGIAMPHILSGL